MADKIDSTSDERTANNVVRHEYRVLTYRIDQAPTLQYTVLRLRLPDYETTDRPWLQVWEQIGCATRLEDAISIAERDQEQIAA